MKKKVNIAKDSFEYRNLRLHNIGKIWIFFALLLITAVPVACGIYFQTAPDWNVFADGGVIMLIIMNLLAGAGEVVAYAPVIGTNGAYLAFVTGNLSNLKIPCVVKAQEIMGTKIGTEENEIVSTIAIAVSSLVTVLIIGIGVLCLAFSGLQEFVDNNKFLTPAFGCVVYALFGSLGGKYIVKNPKLSIFPAIVVVIISVVAVLISGKNIGTPTLFIGIIVCLLFAIFQVIREKKKLAKKEELKRLEAIAAGMSYEEVLRIDAVNKQLENNKKNK